MNCLHKSKAENAEKNSNHEFWRKMFCLVVITFTFPKVSVTASKRVPRREKLGSLGFQRYTESAQRFLKLNWLVESVHILYLYT